jgi:SAM-dependent methyltransferase
MINPRNARSRDLPSQPGDARTSRARSVLAGFVQWPDNRILMSCPSLYDIPTLYDRLIRQGPCEPFYTGLAQRTGGPVLELACGTGRLTIPLALAGHDVVGLDASTSMLRLARVKARAVDVEITFVHADMCTFALGRQFPLIMMTCNSLAHLSLIDELRNCLTTVRRHLAPGGLFAFDVVNPNVRHLARACADHVTVEVEMGQASDLVVEEIASYDPVQQIRVAEWRVREAGSHVRDIAPLRLRQFFPQEVALLLASAGLELACRYGDFDYGPLTGESANQICLARSRVDI